MFVPRFNQKQKILLLITCHLFLSISLLLVFASKFRRKSPNENKMVIWSELRCDSKSSVYFERGNAAKWQNESLALLISNKIILSRRTHSHKRTDREDISNGIYDSTKKRKFIFRFAEKIENPIYGNRWVTSGKRKGFIVSKHRRRERRKI